MIERTIIEFFVCLLFIICFWNEGKFIAFEQKVVRLFKDIVAICKAARKQRIPFTKFLSICYLCAIEEFEEHHPWCGELERKLIKDISFNVIAMFIAIVISILIIQRWGR